MEATTVSGTTLTVTTEDALTVLTTLTILVAHSLRGMFGVALGALHAWHADHGIDHRRFQLHLKGGDIAEMSQLDGWVRGRADVLDAEGTTTVMIGKGFAIGSAGLVSLALFRTVYVWRGLLPQMGIHRPVVWRGADDEVCGESGRRVGEGVYAEVPEDCPIIRNRGLDHEGTRDASEKPGTVWLVFTLWMREATSMP